MAFANIGPDREKTNRLSDPSFGDFPMEEDLDRELKRGQYNLDMSRGEFADAMVPLWRGVGWLSLRSAAGQLGLMVDVNGSQTTHDELIKGIATEWGIRVSLQRRKEKITVPDQPNLLPGNRQLELELYRWAEDFDLANEVDRGYFMQRMLECWRVEGFGRLRDAARGLDIEITARTLHDELIKKIVGRWIQALLKHREKPRFDIGQRVMFRTDGVGTIPSHAVGSNETVEVVAEGGSHVGQVLVKGVYRAWIPVEDLLKF